MVKIGKSVAFLSFVIVSLGLSGQKLDSVNQVVVNRQLDYFVDSDTTKYPLKPPNTSSPRATLQHFVTNMNRAYRLIKSAYEESTREAGLFYSQSVKQ